MDIRPRALLADPLASAPKWLGPGADRSRRRVWLRSRRRRGSRFCAAKLEHKHPEVLEVARALLFNPHSGLYAAAAPAPAAGQAWPGERRLPMLGYTGVRRGAPRPSCTTVYPTRVPRKYVAR